jgi:hypothetical protein
MWTIASMPFVNARCLDARCVDAGSREASSEQTVR